MPAIAARTMARHLRPVLGMATFKGAVLAADFILLWGVVAENHVFQARILAGVALVTMLLKYAFDMYHVSWEGLHPKSSYEHNGWDDRIDLGCQCRNFYV